MKINEVIEFCKSQYPEDEWRYDSETKVFMSSNGRIAVNTRKKGLLIRCYNDLTPVKFNDIESGCNYYNTIHPGIWKYSEKYHCYVCYDGTIGSAHSRRTGPDKNGLLKKYVQNNGYVSYNNTTVHRVVFETFSETDIPKDKEINHRDRNKLNNCFDNLELATHKENINYKEIQPWKGKSGEHPASEPVLQYDLEGNFIREWPSQNMAAKELGISQASISFCCGGRYKTTCGYMFKYKKQDDANRREHRNNPRHK